MKKHAWDSKSINAKFYYCSDNINIWNIGFLLKPNFLQKSQPQISFLIHALMLYHSIKIVFFMLQCYQSFIYQYSCVHNSCGRLLFLSTYNQLVTPSKQI